MHLALCAFQKFKQERFDNLQHPGLEKLGTQNNCRYEREITITKGLSSIISPIVQRQFLQAK